MKKVYYVLHKDDDLLVTQNKEEALKLLSKYVTYLTEEELTQQFEEALERGFCGISCSLYEEYSIEVHDEEV